MAIQGRANQKVCFNNCLYIFEGESVGFFQGVKDFVISWLTLVFIVALIMLAYDWYESQISAKDLIGTYNVIEMGIVGLPPMKLEEGQLKIIINGTNEPNKLFIGGQKPTQRPAPFEKATFDGEYLVYVENKTMVQVTVVKGVGYKFLWVKKNQYGIIERE